MFDHLFVFIGVFVFILLKLQKFILYIFWMSICCWIHILWIFSPKIWFDSSAESLNVDDIKLSIFNGCGFLCPVSRHLAFPWWWRYSPMLASRSFVAFIVTFSSMIHLRLVSVCDVRPGWGSFSLFVDTPLFSTMCWEDFYFPVRLH